MSGEIWQDLKDEFGFTGVLGGPEYELMPQWQRIVADQLLEHGMVYRVAKSNARISVKNTRKYINYVTELVDGTATSIPMFAKMGDVKAHVDMMLLLQDEIRTLIRIYNSGE